MGKNQRWNGPQPSRIALFATIAVLVNVLHIAADKGAEDAKKSPYASVQASSKMFAGVYSSASPVHDATLCPWYGCSYLPSDIEFDTEAQSILEHVRYLTLHKDEADDDSSLTTLMKANADHTTLTLMGYKGGDPKSQVNQDRSFVISPFMEMSVPSAKKYMEMSVPSDGGKQPVRRLLGVFDGHGPGGEFVSDHTVTKIPALIASKLTEMMEAQATHQVGGDDTTTMAEEAAAEEEEVVIKKILFDAFLEMDKTAPAFVTGGCTATVVLQFGGKIYIANAGDSRSLIATYRKSTGAVDIVYATREDKPELPDEKARVERMGGRVRLAQQEGGTSRVMYTDRMSRREYGLAMSRSIGDWDAGKVGVIPDPIVDVLHLAALTTTSTSTTTDDGASEEQTICTVNASGEQKCTTAAADEEGDIEVFAISATDGLLDVISKENIAKYVAEGIYGTDSNSPHLLTVCEKLITVAKQIWGEQYRDDIAIAVSRLT